MPQNKKITRNRRLTKAYNVVSNFSSIPNFRTYQENLIKIYYNSLKLGKDNTVPLRYLSKNQVRSASTRLYNQAHELINKKTPEEKAIIKNLSLLEKKLKKGQDTELLDDWICRQLEPFPDNSDLVQEYNIIKGY